VVRKALLQRNDVNLRVVIRRADENQKRMKGLAVGAISKDQNGERRNMKNAKTAH